ncbi:MAG TPA: hypothetical protein VEQ35_10850 [Beijerinckia sp.]|nr:hypothetical protein [Beijerinckia sp.]
MSGNSLKILEDLSVAQGPVGMNILRLVLLGLAAVAAVFLGWTFLQQAIQPEKSPTVEASTFASPSHEDQASLQDLEKARSKIADEIATSPDYMRFFERLKSRFPADYQSFLTASAKRMVVTGDMGGADRLMSEAVRTLRLSHGVLAAKADTPALAQIFVMQLAMLQALAAKDQRLCVDFLYGGASRDFFQFSAENRALIVKMALAGLDAITDGEAKRIERAAPNDADFAMLDQALRDKGLDTPEIEALLDGKTSDPPLEDARVCHAGTIYLETLAELPEPTRSRIYGLAVELMARS